MRYYKRDESMIGRKIVDEMILVPVKQNIAETQNIYSLNEIGGRIWELLDGGNSIETLVSILVQEYSVDIKQAESDVKDFLNHLEQIGAVTTIITDEDEES
jgi:hypothetical protein